MKAQSRINRFFTGFIQPPGRYRACSYGSIAGAIYVLGFICTMVFVPVAKGGLLRLNSPAVIAFAFIALAPPIWFFFESAVVFGPGHGSDEDYKHSQELASRIWIAFS